MAHSNQERRSQTVKLRQGFAFVFASPRGDLVACSRRPEVRVGPVARQPPGLEAEGGPGAPGLSLKSRILDGHLRESLLRL